MAKLWGGRFEGGTDEFAERFQASIAFDSRMYREDITGSIAHARMLGAQGIIPKEDSQAIIAGLLGILSDIDAGKTEFSVSDEDIHMNIERLLTERIGSPAARLHTGRSRNDQVALDVRLYMKREIAAVREELKALLTTLVSLAEKHTDDIIPAYTHLQKAQPTTLAHWLMAYFEMLRRDDERFCDCFKRTDYMPLGAGALCGTTYPLDRDAVADELGFASVTRNSMDSVSDRDFLLEFLSCASICQMHLSRFCEEIILWNTNEFSAIRLSDAYSTGSSIMPQKKNPDMAELIRGKTGRVYGDLISLLTVMKGLPLAYNKDMQEDKECVFDAADTLLGCLTVFNGMIATASFNTARLYKSAGLGFTNATDAADYLVTKGLPFREAHEVIGHMVLKCEKEGRALADLSADELSAFSPLFESDVYDAISLEACVGRRKVFGAPASVPAQIELAREYLKAL